MQLVDHELQAIARTILGRAHVTERVERLSDHRAIVDVGGDVPERVAHGGDWPLVLDHVVAQAIREPAPHAARRGARTIVCVVEREAVTVGELGQQPALVAEALCLGQRILDLDEVSFTVVDESREHDPRQTMARVAWMGAGDREQATFAPVRQLEHAICSVGHAH
jgi:hypothetical protein